MSNKTYILGESYHSEGKERLNINLYLTEFVFGVCVHHTEFPFKSLHVSDNKRFVSCEPSVMK